MSSYRDMLKRYEEKRQAMIADLRKHEKAGYERDLAFHGVFMNLPRTGEPPIQTQDFWVKKISRRVFVDGDIALGEFVELFQEAWTDAYAKGVRDAKR